MNKYKVVVAFILIVGGFIGMMYQAPEPESIKIPEELRVEIVSKNLKSTTPDQEKKIRIFYFGAIW
jgi:hypothetical protein